ncbi:MAG TPA: sensor histidine kinase [Bacteroidales bacterium]|nr:sensor histidine kinase [Bacteroidales bacterium]
MESKGRKRIISMRSWRMHAIIAAFSFAVVLYAYLTGTRTSVPEDLLSTFFLVAMQMEIFMAIAIKIFNGIEPGNDRKKITRIMLSRFALFIGICFMIAFLVVTGFIILRSRILGLDTGMEIDGFFATKFANWLKGTLTGLAFGAVVFIFLEWQDALRREQKLREENLIFQNETLKTQINPHFLFNNLNTLSSLINKSSDDAETFISRLSSIYRYIIENSRKDRVPLAEELSFIEDYFFLYKIRDGEKISMRTDIAGNSLFYIIPVSLQILVENAIKHNMATREEPLVISVYLEGESVVVKNKVQKPGSQVRSTGIGLKNLSERVRLISGEVLIIDESGNYFTVKIPLMR